MPTPPRPPARPAPRPVAPVAARPPRRPAAAPRQELAEFQLAPDPLAKVEYTGDLERDSAAELEAIDAGWRERRAREQQRVNDELDSENWIAVVFETRAQKEAFLQALNLLEHGDKYLDGRDVAKALNVDLPPSGRVFRPEPKINPRWAALAKPPAKR